MLEGVRAVLADTFARVEGTFESEEDTHYALEQTRDRLAELLVLLGVEEVPEPILATEDGCPACGAHWGWTAWASDADKAIRRGTHAQVCREALALVVGGYAA